jgi:hypothetical protein
LSSGRTAEIEASMGGFDLGNYLSGLIITIIKFAYPTYASYKAIRSEISNDDQSWLVYWTIIGFESFFESYIIPFLAWVPFFMLLRIVFYIWLQLPFFNGSIVIFKKFVQPFFENSSLVGVVPGDKRSRAARRAEARRLFAVYQEIRDSLKS